MILDKRAVEIRASSSAPLSSIDNGFDIIGGEEEGRVYSINSVSKNTLNKSTSTAEVAKETLKDLPEGTFIKVKARTSSGSTVTHFMIVSRASEDDVILYHANYGGNCKVRNMRITYEVFANNFPYVYYTC